jgi:tetratricopeptide (TPR) repeat protein
MKSRSGRVLALIAALLLAGVLLVGGIVLGARTGSGDSVPGTPAGGATPATSSDPLSQAIARTQTLLAAEPRNWDAWATLGSAYIQQGRITADPSYYPKAEAALRRALQLNGTDNYLALAGLGALAAARHDFAAALQWGRRAAAINPQSDTVYGVLNDAYTQLGDYEQARAAVQRMLDLRPGVASWTRASYDFEERGLLGPAGQALERALEDASSPADVAFCRYYLGELAFNSGQLAEAANQYAAGLRADPTYVALLEGRAKVEAARGQPAAIADYTTVVQRVPLPQYVVEFGNYLASIGRTGDAQQQYAVLRSEERLFAANGVTDDLLPAEFDADHGDPASALEHARREWGRRHSVLVADALGWALHQNHRDAEAVGYARQATRLGWHNALFYFHLGMIEKALGRVPDARADLGRAVGYNPYFDPVQAPIARQALAGLGGGG